MKKVKFKSEGKKNETRCEKRIKFVFAAMERKSFKEKNCKKQRALTEARSMIDPFLLRSITGAPKKNKYDACKLLLRFQVSDIKIVLSYTVSRKSHDIVIISLAIIIVHRHGDLLLAEDYCWAH